MDKYTKIQTQCKNIASSLISIETNRELDHFVGYTDGIMQVLQYKYYQMSNAIYFELEGKRTGSNYSRYNAPLTLYYVSQEIGFYDWFIRKDVYKLTNHCKIINHALLNILQKYILQKKEILENHYLKDLTKIMLQYADEYEW